MAIGFCRAGAEPEPVRALSASPTAPPPWSESCGLGGARTLLGPSGVRRRVKQGFPGLGLRRSAAELELCELPGFVVGRARPEDERPGLVKKLRSTCLGNRSVRMRNVGVCAVVATLVSDGVGLAICVVAAVAARRRISIRVVLMGHPPVKWRRRARRHSAPKGLLKSTCEGHRRASDTPAVGRGEARIAAGSAAQVVEASPRARRGRRPFGCSRRWLTGRRQEYQRRR